MEAEREAGGRGGERRGTETARHGHVGGAELEGGTASGNAAAGAT